MTKDRSQAPRFTVQVSASKPFGFEVVDAQGEFEPKFYGKEKLARRWAGYMNETSAPVDPPEIVDPIEELQAKLDKLANDQAALEARLAKYEMAHELHHHQSSADPSAGDTVAEVVKS